MSWKTHCKYAHYILKIIKAKPSQSRAILLHFNIKVCTICFNKKISTIKEIGHKMNCNYLQERKKKKEKEICCSCRVLLFFSRLLDEDVWLSRYGVNTFHSSCQISHLLKLHKCRHFGPLYLWYSGKWPYYSSVIFYKWTWCGKDHCPEIHLFHSRTFGSLLSDYGAQWDACV